MEYVKKFRMKNPYRLDDRVVQEVSVSLDLKYSYEECEWIGVDTEYLSFNYLQDKLCVIQISSKPKGASNIRVELIYVFEKKVPEKLKLLMVNKNIEKIFHVFSSDMPRIENYIRGKVNGKIFDTKVAAKIAWTNTQNHGMDRLIQMFCDPDFGQKDNTSGLNDWEVGPENWTEDQIYYMAQDVLYLHVLKVRILEMAERRGWKDLVEASMSALPVVSELHKYGYTERVFGY